MGSSNQDDPPYSDTQLLVSLLGVLVFPHERTPDALGELLRDYGDLSAIVTIRHPTNGVAVGDLTDTEGKKIDPATIDGLPRLLRNSIAHFNIRPIEKHGRFAGVRVWNESDDGRITLVADLDFDALRPLARHILSTLATGQRYLSLDDPPDPLEMLESQADAELGERTKKSPRLSDTIWERWLALHDGDPREAKVCN